MKVLFIKIIEIGIFITLILNIAVFIGQYNIQQDQEKKYKFAVKDLAKKYKFKVDSLDKIPCHEHKILKTTNKSYVLFDCDDCGYIMQLPCGFRGHIECENCGTGYDTK